MSKWHSSNHGNLALSELNDGSIVMRLMCNILLVLILWVITPEKLVAGAEVCDRYASPTGMGNGLSVSSPFKINKFWSVAGPGKTLCLLDGTYTGSESMIDPPDNLSGTAGKPITVRALNDGKVTLDGQGMLRPVLLNYNNYFVLEGFNAHSSREYVVRIVRSNNNIVRRVIAWDAYDGDNGIVAAGSSEYILFEDVAAWGSGRKVFEAAQGGNHVTCRRCWGRWEGSHFMGPKHTYTLAYNNYDMLIENSIGTWSGEKMQETYSLRCPTGQTNTRCGQKMTGYAVDQPRAIFGVDALNQDKNARSKVLGSIAYITKQDRFDPGHLYWVVNLDSVEYNNNAAYIEPGSHTNKRSFSLYNSSYGANNLIAKNMTSVSASASVIQSQWQKSNISEGKSVSSVGSLYSSSQGAQICKRYKDGVLTSEPLWPWPMNQRIKDAMVTSGRAAVDVTQTIESMFGVVPTDCRAVGTNF